MVELVNPVGNLTEDKLREVEQRMGMRLPADYRQFLLEHNGGRPKPAVFDIQWPGQQDCGEDWKSSEVSRFLAIHDGDKANFSAINEVDFRDRLPRDTIAIAQDPAGNVILLAVTGALIGKVMFWVKDLEAESGVTPGYDNVGMIADSFDEFLNGKLR